MPNISNTVTFLFAGDGSLASEGLSLFLQTKSNFQLISECSDGATAVADIEEHSPEIAVIDAHLSDMNALQIIESVRAVNQDTRLIILGASADRSVADQLMAAGADAYVVRSGPSRHLNDAIRYVRDGGKYLAPQLTRNLPMSSEVHPTDDCESVISLRKAVEAQACTVEKLERAMDRAQQAIELLQQKVEKLTGVPIEAPGAEGTSEDIVRSRMIPGLRAKVSSVAAALMVGLMGFMLAGILKPSSHSSVRELASIGSEDALQASSTSSLHLAGWESDTLANATSMLRNQQYSAAEKACRTLLKQNPANTAASRVLASALFHQNRVEETADVVRSMAVPKTYPMRPAPPLSFNN